MEKEVATLRYEIGKRIRRFRQQRGLSQKALAAQIGVSCGRVSNWEQGLNRPDADILAAICDALQVSADELLDVRLAKDDLNDEERQLILQYRRKPALQPAVRILLALTVRIDSPAPPLPPFPPPAPGRPSAFVPPGGRQPPGTPTSRRRTPACRFQPRPFRKFRPNP